MNNTSIFYVDGKERGTIDEYGICKNAEGKAVMQFKDHAFCSLTEDEEILYVVTPKMYIKDMKKNQKVAMILETGDVIGTDGKIYGKFSDISVLLGQNYSLFNSRKQRKAVDVVMVLTSLLLFATSLYSSFLNTPFVLLGIGIVYPFVRMMSIELKCNESKKELKKNYFLTFVESYVLLAMMAGIAIANYAVEHGTRFTDLVGLYLLAPAAILLITGLFSYIGSVVHFNFIDKKVQK